VSTRPARSAPAASRNPGNTDRRPSARRKQEIVEAAVQLMHEAGFASTSVRDIGKAVGMQSGSLYYYFREKEDILCEIQLMLNELIAAIPQKVEESGARPLERIRLLMAHHLAMVDDNLALCHVGYTEYRHLRPEQVGQIEGPQRDYNEYLVQLLIAAQREGEVHEDLDPRTCAGAIFALLNSIIWWRRPGSRPTIEELSATYERMLLNGLSTRSGEEFGISFDI
jgi:TetR/AcrR family transcriptional regulator, cholesterol catabolism regulator